MANAEPLVFAGAIHEALPNALFVVRLENNREIVASLSAGGGVNRLSPKVGDRVLVESPPYDLTRGVITLLVG